MNGFPWGVSAGLLFVTLGCLTFIAYILRLARLGK